MHGFLWAPTRHDKVLTSYVLTQQTDVGRVSRLSQRMLTTYDDEVRRR